MGLSGRMFSLAISTSQRQSGNVSQINSHRIGSRPNGTRVTAKPHQSPERELDPRNPCTIETPQHLGLWCRLLLVMRPVPLGM
jgi:hypothetical protein